MRVIEQLKKVQDLNLLIEYYEDELSKMQAEPLEVMNELSEKLEEAKKIFREKELLYKKKEGELELEVEKLKEKEELLNSGSLKQKEIQSLEKDVETRKKHIELLESELKEAKSELKELEERIARYEDSLQKFSKKLEEDAAKRKEFQKIIEDKKKELEELLDKLPEDAKKLFLELKRIYRHEVVVPVEIVEEGKPKYYCSACSIQLSKSEVDSLKKDKKSIHICPYCGRIIYYQGK